MLISLRHVVVLNLAVISNSTWRLQSKPLNLGLCNKGAVRCNPCCTICPKSRAVWVANSELSHQDGVPIDSLGHRRGAAAAQAVYAYAPII
jgi:hypothetical protein